MKPQITHIDISGNGEEMNRGNLYALQYNCGVNHYSFHYLSTDPKKFSYLSVLAVAIFRLKPKK